MPLDIPATPHGILSKSGVVIVMGWGGVTRIMGGVMGALVMMSPE